MRKPVPREAGLPTTSVPWKPRVLPVLTLTPAEKPGLALSWKVSGHGKVWTFALRHGVKFHDGTPFNGDAVKFTLDRVIDPATKAGQSHDQLGPYDHTEVVDDHTVEGS